MAPRQVRITARAGSALQRVLNPDAPPAAARAYSAAGRYRGGRGHACTDRARVTERRAANTDDYQEQRPGPARAGDRRPGTQAPTVRSRRGRAGRPEFDNTAVATTGVPHGRGHTRLAAPGLAATQSGHFPSQVGDRLNAVKPARSSPAAALSSATNRGQAGPEERRRLA